MPKDLQSLEHYLEEIEPIDTYIYEEVNSTNSIASELAREAFKRPILVVANKQTAGRGRMGRHWYSPANSNIYMSLVLKLNAMVLYPELITLYSAVCVWQVIGETVKESLGHLWIKWPNDLYWEDKKLGGILTESLYSAGKPEFFVIGIGLNVNSDKEEIQRQTDLVWTSLRAETARDYKRDSLIAGITGTILKDLYLLSEPDRITKMWKERTRTIGARVKVITGNYEFEGLAEDIDSKGHLIVRDAFSGDRVTISTADIVHIR